MPLPTQVVEQLSREPVKTPGWSSGLLFFSGGVAVVVFVLYLGLIFAYRPYLNSRIATIEEQIDILNQQVSADAQNQLISFYSQISNVRSLLGNHVFFSHFLSWLESHTQANVSFGNLNFSNGNQIILVGLTKTQADMDQQLAAFESAPDVKSARVSNISFVSTSNVWQFTISLVMQPSVFAWQN